MIKHKWRVPAGGAEPGLNPGGTVARMGFDPSTLRKNKIMNNKRNQVFWPVIPRIVTKPAFPETLNLAEVWSIMADEYYSFKGPDNLQKFFKDIDENVEYFSAMSGAIGAMSKIVLTDVFRGTNIKVEETNSINNENIIVWVEIPAEANIEINRIEYIDCYKIWGIISDVFFEALKISGNENFLEYEESVRENQLLLGNIYMRSICVIFNSLFKGTGITFENSLNRM